MKYQYVMLVAGSGETSRANVDALIEDQYYANGKDGVLVIAFVMRPSAGQIWAAQLAASKGLDIVIMSPEHGAFDGLPQGTRVTTNNPFDEACQMAESFGDNGWAFILWSDDDPESAECLSYCKKYGVRAMDLRNGLADIEPAPSLEPQERPAIPEEETVPEIAPETPSDEVLDDSSDDEDYIDDEDTPGVDISEAIYSGMYAFAEMIADIVVERLKK